MPTVPGRGYGSYEEDSEVSGRGQANKLTIRQADSGQTLSCGRGGVSLLRSIYEPLFKKSIGSRNVKKMGNRKLEIGGRKK